MSHQTSALGLGSAHAEALYAYRVAAPVRCTREQIAALRANRPYQNVAELLLGDPRRRALLRTVGVAEDFVFGDGADLEVLRAFCAAMEGAPDNLAHAQVRFELEKVLGITLPLCADTADEIWAQSAARFSATDVTPRALLSHSAASALLVFCAPEDGLDGLSAGGVRVLPLFCPEGLLDPADPSFLHTVSALSLQSNTLEGLQEALSDALARFAAKGCRVAVHNVLPRAFVRPDPYHAEQAFQKCLRREVLDARERALLQAQLWRILCMEYAKRDMALEIVTGGVSVGIAASAPRAAVHVTEYAALRSLLDYLGGCSAVIPTLLYLSSPLEVPEAALLAMAYPAIREGVPRLSLGLVGGSAMQERALLSALSAALPLGQIAGRFTDLRLPNSLLDGEIFAARVCAFLAECEMEKTQLHTLVRRLTGENQQKIFL